MAYMKSIWRSVDRRLISIKKYYAFRALPENPKIREKRAGRQQQTTAAQREINHIQKVERQIRLLTDNFSCGDWYVTLTYSGKRPPGERVKKDWQKFKEQVRRIYRRAGHEMKYIGVLENMTGNGRPHGHIILPALTPVEMKKIMKAWPNGIAKVKLYGGEAMDAARMGEYFCKEEFSHVTSSRNLIRREPKKTKVTRSEAYKTEINVPHGYRIVKQLTYCGWTADGYPIQHIVFERCG